MSSQRTKAPAHAAAPSEPGGRRAVADDPFFRRAAAVTGLVAATLVLLLFLWEVAGVLLVVFAGILLAVLLHGLAARLSAHTPLSYGWSLLVTCLLLVSVLTLTFWLIIPPVADQVVQLRNVVPESMNRAEDYLNQFGWGAFVIERVPDASEIVSGEKGFWSRMTGILSTTLGLLANVLIILAIGVYLAISPGLYVRGIVRLVPAEQEAKARRTLHAVGHALWHWLTGQFISMTIIGVLVWLGLTLLGIPLALGLGFIAGLLEFVPLIGPWVGAVPGLLVALMQGPEQMLYVGLLYFGIQQIESNLVTPLVMEQAVSLPPALTISATLVGGALFGIPGILLATPLTVAVMVLLQDVYVQGVLGKRDDQAEAEH